MSLLAELEFLPAEPGGAAWARVGLGAVPLPELPGEPVWRQPADPDEAAVDAVEVVGRAEAGEVLALVAAAVGAVEDVVRVDGRPAAARHPAAVAVAGERAEGR